MGAPATVEVNVVAMKANGTVTANRVVKANTTEGEVLHTTAITEAVFGVALNTVSTGQAVSVETGAGAIVKMVASAAISVGDRLMPGANGKVATAAGATAIDCGVALSAAGADGEVIVARLNPMGKSPVNT